MALNRRFARSVLDAFEQATAAAVAGEAPGLQRIQEGVGPVSAFEELEAKTRQSSYTMLPMLHFEVDEMGEELDRRSRERGIDMRTLVAPNALDRNPLDASRLPLFGEHVRLGPVDHVMMLIDRSAVVTRGAPLPDGTLTMWIVTRPDLVKLGEQLWDETWACSTELIPPGRTTLFTMRQVRVGTMVARGFTDQRIARELGVSGRTVSNEIAVLQRELGATGRVQLAGRISGAEVTPGVARRTRPAPDASTS